MKRAIVLLFFLVACKHTTTTDGALVEPEHVNLEAGPCSGPCCTRPRAGAPCEIEAGTDDTCAWSNHCATGLITSEETQCKSGAWVVISGACPAEGQTDERGCPASQPAPDSACEPLDGGGTCGYVIACEGGISATAQATCVNGKWQTTPLKC